MDNLEKRVKKLIKQHGEAGAGKMLDMPRNTLARVAAGLPVRRATLAWVEVKLAEVENGRA